MPTYEYACSACKHEWEIEQSMKDAAITECPACHAATAKRQISRGSGFILKGGGWAADAYGSGGKAQGSTKTSVTMDQETGATTKTITKVMPDGSSESETRAIPTPTTPPVPAPGASS